MEVNNEIKFIIVNSQLLSLVIFLSFRLEELIVKFLVYKFYLFRNYELSLTSDEKIDQRLRQNRKWRFRDVRRHGGGCLDTGRTDGGIVVAEAAGKGRNHLRNVRRQSVTVRMRH